MLFLFDCYGTLVRRRVPLPSPHDISGALSERVAIPLDDAQLVVFTLYAGLVVPHRPQHATDAVLTAVLERLARPDLRADVETFLWETFGQGASLYEAVPGAAALLDAIRAAGHRTGLISNCILSPTRMDQLLTDVELRHRLDGVAYSSAGDGKKPSHDFFRAAAGDAEDVVVVGDGMKDDIAPAQDLGWRAFPVAGSQADWRPVHALLDTLAAKSVL